jgi:hypothetical protein
MKTIGSQKRETLEESGLTLHKRISKKEVILADGDKFELWFLNDHHAGYTIEIDGKGYEFAHSLLSV